MPRTTFWMSTYPLVVISPPTTTRPTVMNDSQATRPCLSCSMMASRMPSDIWSQTLSGCPSVTDSEVKRKLADFIPLPCSAVWFLSKMSYFGGVAHVERPQVAIDHGPVADHGVGQQR